MFHRIANLSRHAAERCHHPILYDEHVKGKPVSIICIGFISRTSKPLLLSPAPQNY